MPVVNVRELSRKTSQVVSAVSRTKRATLVTRAGRPIAAVVPVDEDAIEDWILANAPEFVASMREADHDLRAGRTITLEELLGSERPRRKRAAKLR